MKTAWGLRLPGAGGRAAARKGGPQRPLHETWFVHSQPRRMRLRRRRRVTQPPPTTRIWLC
eukprot:5069174-Lingulodinium_polyedra.AAC.1